MKAKKYIRVLSGLLLAALANQGKAQVYYPWFVQTDVAKTAGATTDSLLYSLAARYRQTTRTFVDGLGRPIQSIALQSSPLKNDIIQPVVYDNLGRQTVSYMGYAGKSTDSIGRYRSTALTAQAAFYDQTTQYLIATDTAAHARQVFESSPLQRLLSSGDVGTGYQPGDGGTQHYKTISYRPNTAADDVYMTGTTGAFTSYYAANKLWVTDAVDEDSHEALLFKDLAGRTLLKRQLTGPTPYDTYYIYNNAGAVSYIVPPKAVALLIAGSTLSSPAVANLIYSYSYNSLGLLYAKTVPGKGATFIIYDPQNRPLLTRDSNMYAKHQWYYIKYDAKDRPVETGIYTDAAHTTFSAMLTYVNTAYGSTYWYEGRSTVSAYQYYTNNVFPTTGLTPMAYSYYDNYNFYGTGAYNFAYKTQGLTGEETATSDSLKGMPTMSLKYTIGPGIATPQWLMTVLFYDKYGHVIQSQANNQLYYTAGTLTDASTIVPDFTGKPLVTETKVVTGTATGTTNSVITTFNYDISNMRLSSLDQVYNTQASKRIASYSYNEAGQLILRKLDSLNSAWLQNVDYRYNIRGQMTTINNSTLTNDGGVTNSDSNDLFGMQLLYDQTDPHLATDTAKYSGLLTAVKWMSRNSSNALTNERSYVYSYDKLARYTRANYAERPSGGGSGSFTTNVDGFDENGISYDAGGNILTLKRNTSTIGASSHTQADNLTYKYDSTMPNKLDSIGDTGSATLGFITPHSASGDYGYDNDGNLTSDPYKGLTIKYNSINMADSIIQSSGTYLSYTYDAAGVVVRKQQYSGGTMTTQTDYIGAFVYTTASGTTGLTYITNAEGRLINTGTSPNVTLTPEYIITDDQGNARFSFEDNGTAIVIRQENSYYPLGETYTTSTAGPPTTTPNKKLYNGGSEWQNDITTLPDYQQTFNRNYDAEIGRFIAVDPMPESAMDMTVYQYAGDNPIMMNDPDGAKNSQVGGNEYGTNHAPTGFYQGPNAFDIQDMLDAYEGYASAYDLAGQFYAGGTYGGGQTSYGTGDIGYDIQFQGGSIGARDAASEGTSFLGGAYYQGGVNSYNVYLGDQGHVFVSKDNTLSTSEFHYADSWYMTPEGSYNMTGISNISATQAMSILNANQGGAYQQNMLTAIAMAVGEANNNIAQVNANASTIINRTNQNSTSFNDPNWLAHMSKPGKASGWQSTDGGNIDYNGIMGQGYNKTMASSNPYVQAAIAAFNAWGAVDYSNPNGFADTGTYYFYKLSRSDIANGTISAPTYSSTGSVITLKVGNQIYYRDK